MSEIVKRMSSGGQGVCHVCVSCHKLDDSILAERREKWSKLARIGSVDFLENRTDPKHNR